METNLIARACITIEAPIHRVWEALVTPADIKQYMFGTTVVTDWSEGSPITWQGEWQGRRYEDKGVILKLTPERALQYTHFSPLAGLPDLPENYHTVTIELSGDDNQAMVSLTQDHNGSDEAREHSQRNWELMLGSLKRFLEDSRKL